jgi:hypothetical protein
MATGLPMIRAWLLHLEWRYLIVMGVIAISTAASGQTVDLMCGGKFYQYEPSKIESSVAPRATRIDLHRKRISTPVGEFRISNAEDTAIFFKEVLPGPLLVFGRLDRLSGEMTIFWRRPEEEEKLQAGLTAQTAMYADLRCSVSKRLF